MRYDPGFRRFFKRHKPLGVTGVRRLGSASRVELIDSVAEFYPGAHEQNYIVLV